MSPLWKTSMTISGHSLIHTTTGHCLNTPSPRVSRLAIYNVDRGAGWRIGRLVLRFHDAAPAAERSYVIREAHIVIRLHAAIVLATILAGGIASADVIVRVQVFEEKAKTPAATQPASAAPNRQQSDAALTVETSAPVGGSFLARTSSDQHTVELKGSVKQNGSDPYSVRVKFSDLTEGRAQQPPSSYPWTNLA
jgi:hypothetical protein